MNVSEKTYCLLKQKIIDNEITGAIAEKDLCDSLNVSRTPLREAIFRLISEGWIHYSKNKTKSIREITLKEIKDIFQVRSNIEVLVLNVSWGNQDVGIYKKITHQFEQGLTDNDFSLLLDADSQLHQQLLDDCKNAILSKMLCYVYDRLRMLRTVTDNVQEIYLSSQEHIDICRGIIDRDLPQAEQALLVHVEQSRKRIFDAFMS